MSRVTAPRLVAAAKVTAPLTLAIVEERLPEVANETLSLAAQKSPVHVKVSTTNPPDSETLSLPEVVPSASLYTPAVLLS